MPSLVPPTGTTSPRPPGPRRWYIPSCDRPPICAAGCWRSPATARWTRIDRPAGQSRSRTQPAAGCPGRRSPDRPAPELWSAVAGLPGRQRAAVALKYVSDLDHRGSPACSTPPRDEAGLVSDALATLRLTLPRSPDDLFAFTPRSRHPCSRSPTSRMPSWTRPSGASSWRPRGRLVLCAYAAGRSRGAGPPLARVAATVNPRVLRLNRRWTTPADRSRTTSPVGDTTSTWRPPWRSPRPSNARCSRAWRHGIRADDDLWRGSPGGSAGRARRAPWDRLGRQPLVPRAPLPSVLPAGGASRWYAGGPTAKEGC